MSDLTAELSALAGQWIITTTFVQAPFGPKPTQLCKYNPLRWALLMYPGTSSQGYISPNPALVNGEGWAIQNAFVPLSYSYRDYGGLVQVPWYCLNPNGPSTVNVEVIEVLLQQ